MTSTKFRVYKAGEPFAYYDLRTSSMEKALLFIMKECNIKGSFDIRSKDIAYIRTLDCTGYYDWLVIRA